MSAALRLLCVVAMTGCGRLDFDAIGAGGGGMADGNASCTYATPIAVQTAWSNLGMISTVQSITVEPTGARHLLVIGSAAYCNVKSVVDGIILDSSHLHYLR